uniref:Putative secreted protein n=1 Tax=Anopheles triannulatus TaxID=58253 RepID=A0A2M4B578_9DIPT
MILAGQIEASPHPNRTGFLLIALAILFSNLHFIAEVNALGSFGPEDVANGCQNRLPIALAILYRYQLGSSVRFVEAFGQNDAHRLAVVQYAIATEDLLGFLIPQLGRHEVVRARDVLGGVESFYTGLTQCFGCVDTQDTIVWSRGQNESTEQLVRLIGQIVDVVRFAGRLGKPFDLGYQLRHRPVFLHRVVALLTAGWQSSMCYCAGSVAWVKANVMRPANAKCCPVEERQCELLSIVRRSVGQYRVRFQ